MLGKKGRWLTEGRSEGLMLGKKESDEQSEPEGVIENKLCLL